MLLLRAQQRERRALQLVLIRYNHRYVYAQAVERAYQSSKKKMLDNRKKIAALRPFLSLASPMHRQYFYITQHSGAQL